MPKQGVLKIMADVMYDTLFLPENLSHGKGMMFVIPIGQYAGRTIKQKEHTNSLMCGILPSPEKFLVKDFDDYLLHQICEG